MRCRGCCLTANAPNAASVSLKQYSCTGPCCRPGTADSLIEQLSQKKVSEIFAEDGEESFRELETQVLSVSGASACSQGWARWAAGLPQHPEVLRTRTSWLCAHTHARTRCIAPQELAPFKNCVVATGGGVPTRAENWGHMQGGVSVWLNGSPALLAHRVVGDGTASRPLLAQPEADDAYAAAVARLTGLLEQRRDVYAVADLVISLEGSGPDADIGAPAMEVAYRVLAALNQRIKDDAGGCDLAGKGSRGGRGCSQGGGGRLSVAAAECRLHAAGGQRPDPWRVCFPCLQRSGAGAWTLRSSRMSCRPRCG